MSKIEEIKMILLSHGIRMNINSCGCCDSSWVSFEYKGKLLLNDAIDEEGMGFKMEMITKDEIDKHHHVHGSVIQNQNDTLGMVNGSYIAGEKSIKISGLYRNETINKRDMFRIAGSGKTYASTQSIRLVNGCGTIFLEPPLDRSLKGNEVISFLNESQLKE